MNPIIPPVWLYAIHVADMVYGISLLALIISLFALLLFFLNYAIDDPDDTRKQKGLTTKGMKVCLVIIVVCMIVIILVPDKKTMYAMIAASVITPDNISGVENHIVELIANIANAVNNVK